MRARREGSKLFECISLNECIKEHGLVLFHSKILEVEVKLNGAKRITRRLQLPKSLTIGYKIKKRIRTERYNSKVKEKKSL